MGPAPAGISTSIGTLSDRQIQTMQQERTLANQFIAGAVEKREENDKTNKRINQPRWA
jgi:hypothetical protein